MLVSPSAIAGTTEPAGKPTPQSPHTEVSSTEVLIATQQVLFSTAAAAGIHRDNLGGRLVAVMRRMFAISTDASRPQYYPKRYTYLENAAMARAMERL